MLDRRRLLHLALGAGAALGLGSRLASGASSRTLISRAIPSSGEKIPVVGLGSSATFRTVAQGEDVASLREVLKAMVDHGASVFDTAPSYGASEEVAGRLAGELGITRKIFWATKVNVAPRGGGSADPAAARAQIEESFRRFGVETMDLIQVHNLGDMPVQLGILKELKAAKRVRYIGVTSTSKEQYGDLARVMREEPLDFIGVDYAVDNRSVEEDDPAACRRAQDCGHGLRAIRPHAVVPARRRPQAPGLGGRFRRRELGAVLHQVRARSPSSDSRDPGDEQGEAHGRQYRRRRRART